MDYRIIDVDTHLTEPPDVWTSRVAAKHRALVPRVDLVDGKELWFLGDQRIGAVGPTAPVGWRNPMPDMPTGYADIHPAAYDSNARLELMDKRGVWAEVLYPNVAGFGGQKFLMLEDRELMYECVRAYNDFLVDWTSPDPRRLIPTMASPFWDVEACVREIERCASLGFRAVNFTGEPQVFGLPYLGEAHWDPFWAAACDHDMVVSFHIGSGDFAWDTKRTEARGFTEAYALQSVHLFHKNGLQVCDLLLSGVLPRFPKLRVVSVESGIGWIPFTFEALDYQFLEGGGFKARPEFKKLPSEYFADQMYATFWFEEVAPRDMLGTRIPIDNVLFETDFPHPTCLYDDVEQKIDASLGHLPEDVRHKLLWGNAEALYRITPPVPAAA
ncbi:MAG TPA: amidohydrolase family protein [Acidimicrobiales bacterium]|jgi:predicted TIM-barrel fold metal-dependent hydrolase|nr:amidohydrolase family protein [Acidimicrobiales bacterium]